VPPPEPPPGPPSFGVSQFTFDSANGGVASFARDGGGFRQFNMNPGTVTVSGLNCSIFVTSRLPSEAPGTQRCPPGISAPVCAFLQAQTALLMQGKPGLAIPLRVANAKRPPVREAAALETYTVEGWVPGTGEQVTELNKPIAHTIGYNDDDLTIAKGDPNRFVVATYDEKTGEWIALSVTIDPPTRRVVAEPSHLSWFVFAVYLEEAAPAPETLPETGARSNALPLAAVGLGLALLALGGGLAYKAREEKRATPHDSWWKR
jgi:LPXTG-motif cell wall-anchored protein